MVRLGDGNGPLSATESDIMELCSYTRCELVWNLHLKHAEHKKGNGMEMFCCSLIFPQFLTYLYLMTEGIKDLNNLI